MPDHELTPAKQRTMQYGWRVPWGSCDAPRGVLQRQPAIVMGADEDGEYPNSNPAVTASQLAGSITAPNTAERVFPSLVGPLNPHGTKVLLPRFLD
jgi:hypothetical protein